MTSDLPSAGGAALPLREHVRRTMRLALPVMLARAGLLIMPAVDTIMTGRVAADELAYYAIAMAPQIMVMLVGIGMLTGTVVLVAQADGAGRHSECGRIWRLALMDAAIFGVMAALLLAHGEALLLGLGQEPAIAVGGGGVLYMMAIGLPGILLYSATSMFLEGIGRPRAGMVITAIANIINLILNYLLMYEPFGLPAMGAEGAAVATSIARWFMCVALALYALTMAGHVAYGVWAPLRGHGHLHAKLVRLGLPLALSYSLESGAFSASAVMAGWLGATSLAAYQVCLNVTALIYMLAIGMATATAVRVGNAVGRGDGPGVPIAGWTGFALGIGVMLILMPMIALGRGSIAALYTNAPEVAVIVLPAMLIVAAILIVDAAQGVMIGALRGLADIWTPTAIQLVSFWGLTVPLGYYLAIVRDWGIGGLLWSLFAGLALAGIFLALRFRQITARPIRAV